MPIPDSGRQPSSSSAGHVLLLAAHGVVLRAPIAALRTGSRAASVPRLDPFVSSVFRNTMPRQLPNDLLSSSLPCAASRMKNPSWFPYDTFFHTVASAFGESPT